MKQRLVQWAVMGLAVMATACGSTMPAATADDAKTFVEAANAELLRVATEQQRTEWVAETFITEDTEALGAKASQLLNDTAARLAKEAVKFDKVDVPADVRRQLTLLKVALVLASPSDPKQAEEMAKLVSSMTATYGKGQWCQNPQDPKSCLDVEGVTEVLATSKDPKRLREVWEG